MLVGPAAAAVVAGATAVVAGATSVVAAVVVGPSSSRVGLRVVIVSSLGSVVKYKSSPVIGRGRK